MRVQLDLAVGAPVLIIKNVNNGRANSIYNGLSGVVTTLGDTWVEVQVKLKSGEHVIRRVHPAGMAVKAPWGQISVHQLPLLVGYARTVHRTQGATISMPLYIQIDELGLHQPEGKAYVALSRSVRRESVKLMAAGGPGRLQRNWITPHVPPHARGVASPS